MKEEKCLRCQGGETALVVSILVLLIAIPSVAALVLWRFTRARALTFDIGRFKVTPPSEWHQLKKKENRSTQSNDLRHVCALHPGAYSLMYEIMTTVSWSVQQIHHKSNGTFFPTLAGCVGQLSDHDDRRLECSDSIS